MKVYSLRFTVYRIIFTLLFALCSLLFALYISFAQDRIVAVVNDEIITQKDLDDFSNFMRLQTQKEYLKSELLEILIEDRLILQAALKENLEVLPERINARIESIKRSSRSMEDFENTLKNKGLSLSDLESKIKEQILMYDIIERKIRSKIFVSPQEITNYFLDHPTEFIEPEKRRILSLNIEDHNLANKIKEEFSNFKDFADIASEYSLKIEDLGWLNKEQLRPEISEVIFKLKKGEISSILSLDDRFHIFKVEEILEERRMSLKDCQEEIYNLIFEERMEIALEDWLKELKENSYIKVYEFD